MVDFGEILVLIRRHQLEQKYNAPIGIFVRFYSYQGIMVLCFLYSYISYQRLHLPQRGDLKRNSTDYFHGFQGKLNRNKTVSSERQQNCQFNEMSYAKLKVFAALGYSRPGYMRNANRFEVSHSTQSLTRCLVKNIVLFTWKMPFQNKLYSPVEICLKFRPCLSTTCKMNTFSRLL